MATVIIIILALLLIGAKIKNLILEMEIQALKSILFIALIAIILIIIL